MGSLGFGRLFGRGASAVAAGGDSAAGRACRDLPRRASRSWRRRSRSSDAGSSRLNSSVGGFPSPGGGPVALRIGRPVPLLALALPLLSESGRCSASFRRASHQEADSSRCAPPQSRRRGHPRGAPLRHPGRQALVICLDRHIQQLTQLPANSLLSLACRPPPDSVVGKLTITRPASAATIRRSPPGPVAPRPPAGARGSRSGQRSHSRTGRCRNRARAPARS